MKAYVDKDTCIGCGLCPSVCSEVFHMEDDGKAKASEEELSGDIEGEAEDAAEQCPVDAISVE